MTDKLQLFTEEDFTLENPNGFMTIPAPLNAKLVANLANQLLTSKLEKGYVKDHRHGLLRVQWGGISKDTTINDTHEIFYFTRKIEEEKAEYDLRKRIENVGANQDLKNILLDILDKCGEKLS